MGGGGTGFVNAPLTSTEVRNFKKEIKGLLEDPICCEGGKTQTLNMSEQEFQFIDCTELLKYYQ